MVFQGGAVNKMTIFQFPEEGGQRMIHEWSTRSSKKLFENIPEGVWICQRRPKVISVTDANEVQQGCQQLCRIVMLSTAK